jgi:hypothetical protein
MTQAGYYSMMNKLLGEHAELLAEYAPRLRWTTSWSKPCLPSRL